MRTFEDSFAISCNRTFGELGKQLIAIDKNVFETYAQKLGLLPRVGWEGDVYHFPSFRPLHEEKKGTFGGMNGINIFRLLSRKRPLDKRCARFTACGREYDGNDCSGR